MQPPISEENAGQLQPLLKMVDEFDALISACVAICNATTRRIEEAKKKALRGGDAGVATLLRDSVGRKAQGAFTAFVEDESLSTLVNLKRDKARALLLVSDMAKEAERLQKGGNSEINNAVNALAELRDIAITPEAIKEKTHLVEGSFDTAIRDVEIYGQPHTKNRY